MANLSTLLATCAIKYSAMLLANVLSTPMGNIVATFDFLNADMFSVMRHYCVNLTEQAGKGELAGAIGREKEIDSLVDILTGGGKGNPLVVGGPGTGKTALIEGLAIRIAKGDVPESLRSKRIMKVDLMGLYAGKSNGSGSGVSRLKALFKKAEKEGDILFIDETHLIPKLGLGDAVKLNLDRGVVKVIGATTPTEYGYISKDDAVGRRFDNVLLNEVSMETTIKILRGRAKEFGGQDEVQISDRAYEATVELANRYIKNRNFPDKAIDVMKNAVKLASKRSKSKRIVTEKDVTEVVSNCTGIPLGDMDSKQLKELNSLPDKMKKFVVGQDTAVERVCSSYIRSRLGMNEENKPRGSFIFSGPPGVGKTFLGDMLGSIVGNIIEIDMSYYKDRNSVSDFIGTRLEGSKAGLVDGIWEKPYSVVVFDKIEKACPEVMDIIVDIMSRGYMMSSDGKKIDFINTFIIMNTNVGGRIVIDGTSENIKEDILLLINTRFGDGLCKEVDDILVFNKLSDASTIQITSRCLNDASKGLEKFKIKVEFDDEVAKFLSKPCGGAYLGMFSVIKQIKNQISAPISEMVASGKVRKGQRVVCVFIDNKIQFLVD